MFSAPVIFDVGGSKVIVVFVLLKVEVEKKWIETESQRQSGCMTQ